MSASGSTELRQARITFQNPPKWMRGAASISGGLVHVFGAEETHQTYIVDGGEWEGIGDVSYPVGSVSSIDWQ